MNIMEKKGILIIIAIMLFSSIVLASDYVHTNIVVKAEENTRIFLWVYDAPTEKIIRSFNKTISPTGIFDIDLESKPKMMHFKVNVYKDGSLIRQKEFNDRQYPPGGKIILDTLKEEKVENFTVKENSINQETTEENQVKESEETQKDITGKATSQNNNDEIKNNTELNLLFYGILAGFFLILFLGFLIFVGFKFFKKLKSSEKIKVTKLSDKLKEEEEKKKKKEKERLEELEKRLKEIQDEIDRLKNRDKKLEEARKKYEEAKAELERLENLE